VVTVPGAVRNGVPEQVAEAIFDEMVSFASYAFNKSHAAAYGAVTLQTAWLKRHYPVEFMAALMNSFEGNSEKIAYYIQYCRKHGITILPPDVNSSQAKFSVDETSGVKGIRFGLSGVKNLGHPAVNAIVAERSRSGAFRDIYDFIDRLTGNAINKKGVESLIRAGAMDSLPGYRSQKLHVFEKAMDGASKHSKSAIEGQLSLFSFGEEVAPPPPPLPDIREFEKYNLLQMEKEVTGVYITGHPLDEYVDELNLLEVTSQFLRSQKDDAPDGGMSLDQATVSMGGMIAEKRMKATKSGNMMAFVQLEDLYGVTEVLVFPKVYDRVSAMLTQDNPVVLTGKLSVREDEDIKLLLDNAMPLKGYVGGANAPHREPRSSYGSYSRSEQPAPPPAPAEAAAAPRQRRLYLRLSRSQMDGALKILSKTPGGIRVMLYIAEEKKTLAAPMEYWVNENFDRPALEAMLGSESVVVK